MMARKTFTHEGRRYEITAKTKAEAIAKMALKKRDLEEGRQRITKNMTVKKWSKIWLETYIEPIIDNKKTIKDYEARLQNHILPIIGNIQLKNITDTHCQRIMNSMTGYSEDRASKIKNTLFKMFKKAKKNNLILSNPADDLELPKVRPDGTRRAITDLERITMLSVADHHHAGLWVKTMLYCGLRPGETDRMLYAHIDFKNKILYIDGTKSKNAQRYVPLPDSLVEDFKKLNKSPFDHVFTNANGGKLASYSRKTAWNNFKREMNIYLGCAVYRNQVMPPYRVADDLVPYCLRHTFGTDLKDALIPDAIRKELMGHADSDVTDRYTHRTNTSLKIASELLSVYRKEQTERLKSLGNQDVGTSVGVTLESIESKGNKIALSRR